MMRQNPPKQIIFRKKDNPEVFNQYLNSLGRALKKHEINKRRFWKVFCEELGMNTFCKKIFN